MANELMFGRFCLFSPAELGAARLQEGREDQQSKNQIESRISRERKQKHWYVHINTFSTTNEQSKLQLNPASRCCQGGRPRRQVVAAFEVAEAAPGWRLAGMLTD